MDYSLLLSLSENVCIRLQFPPVTPSEICRGQGHDESQGPLLHHSINLSSRLLDLCELPVVENVYTDHPVKIIVYERQLQHVMPDKSDIVDGSSFQSTFKNREGCFRDVESLNLKTSLAEKYGMTTCPAT